MEIERSIEPILLDHGQLALLISKVFSKSSCVEAWELLKGGAQNTNYKFRIGSEEFVLRLYARDRVYCKIEKELHFLVDSSVSTAKLIYADEDHEPWAYSIFQFINGIHISSVNQDFKNSLSYELGKTLALIHSFKFEQAGLFENGLKIGRAFATGSSPYFEETFKILSCNSHARDRLGEPFSHEILSFMRQNKDFFPKIEDNICLTHSDFKPVNLLYNKHGKVFVLDWEFAHAGIGILDFAILLRHRHQFPLELEVLKNGYLQNGGLLPNEWLRSAMITDFVNSVTMMDTPAERPKLFKQLKSNIETTMRHWNFLPALFSSEVE